MGAREKFIIISTLILISLGFSTIYWSSAVWVLFVIGPIVLLGYVDILQKKQAIKKNFPLLGHGRYLLEKIRPEIMQYFVETDTEGRPINRMYRTLVYRRAKKTNDTVPFGTQMDVYRIGYEWLDHSMYAFNYVDVNPHPRITVGGPDCKKRYSASLLNISAMSFGSLSKNAILAFNKGAKKRGFAHNTGEGGISPYHLKYGGDLIWQIGTGYFGCRTKEGKFCPDTFAKKAALDNVKMIEIKLSQGAKPGHGGILPASKNTLEISKIRDVPVHTDVISPPTHSTFHSPDELMEFIHELRVKSGGKPIGFKLCVGKKQEFINLCKAMVSTGIKPDFITVDGGEGGTGAAPVEFSNSLGMPLRDALAFVYDTLIGFDLKKDIKIIASGMVITGFHIARTISLGADMVNSARAMMMAAGCIQALQCNQNTCPVGVATQDKSLTKGLNVDDKAERVANFHHTTLHSFSELIAAAGVANPSDLRRNHINRRVNMNSVMRYDEVFPYIEKGSLLAIEEKLKP